MLHRKMIVNGFLLVGLVIAPLALNQGRLTFADAEAQCGQGATSVNNQWAMVSASCAPSTPTVQGVFADDPFAAYGTDWMVLDRDEINESYIALNLNSSIFQGVGYWLKSISGSNIPWDVDGVVTPVVNSAACPSSHGCFEIPLIAPASAGLNRKNMIGHPFPDTVPWADVRIVVGTNVYTPAQAAANNILTNTIWKFNGSSYDAYDDATPGQIGMLNAYDGFWVEVLDGAISQTTKLLIPKKGNVVGHIAFDQVGRNTSTNGLDYCNITQLPARGVIVEAIDAANNTTVLASASTDVNGDYSLAVTENTNMFVRVKAQMRRTGMPSWDFTVVDNTNGKALYTMDGTQFNSGTSVVTKNLNAASGFTGNCANVGTQAYSATRVAAPFAMLDAVYKSYQKVLTAVSTTQFAPLAINWSVNNVSAWGDNTIGQIGTSYYGNGELYILGDDGGDTDEYDDHVVIHEWGHYYEDNLSRSDSIGGSHSSGDRLDLTVAFGEGWGNALSGMVTNDPVYRDSSGASNDSGFSIDVENNSVTNPGWYSKGSVQSILYDLFDNVNDGVDTIALGFAPIHQIMIGQQKTTTAVTSIFSFITALKAANPADVTAINNLVTAQGIVSNTINEWGSTETNNVGGTANVLSIHTELSVGGSAVNLCTINQFGSPNKLSNYRNLTIDVPAAGSYQVTATKTSGFWNTDPDLILYEQGTFIAWSGAATANSETLNASLQPGTHILRLWDNLTNSISCYDIQVTAQ